MKLKTKDKDNVYVDIKGDYKTFIKNTDCIVYKIDTCRTMMKEYLRCLHNISSLAQCKFSLKPNID